MAKRNNRFRSHKRDLVEITIEGKGGHGATPHGTVDAIIVASQIIQSLQTIVSRNTNPLENDFLSKDDGTKVKIKSPLCCGQDITCST